MNSEQWIVKSEEVSEPGAIATGFFDFGLRIVELGMRIVRFRLSTIHYSLISVKQTCDPLKF